MRKERIELNKIKQDKTFQKSFEEFILYCRVKNLRETTIRYYKNMMRHVIYKFFKPLLLSIKIPRKREEKGSWGV
ncbi:hypothetical protein ACYUJ6_17090 [Clostridium sp. JNZ X4-2]